MERIIDRIIYILGINKNNPNHYIRVNGMYGNQIGFIKRYFNIFK